MKKFGIVVQEEKDGKMFSYVLEVTDSENIYNTLSNITNIKTANIYNTIKKAKEVSNRYNQIFKEQEKYILN